MSYKKHQQKLEKIFLTLIIFSIIFLIGTSLFLLRFALKTINEANFLEKPKESNLHFELLKAEKILFQEH